MERTDRRSEAEETQAASEAGRRVLRRATALQTSSTYGIAAPRRPYNGDATPSYPDRSEGKGPEASPPLPRPKGGEQGRNALSPFLRP